LKRFTTVFALAALTAMPAAQTYAQSEPRYPTRPIRFVIGFTPGGQPDITTRIIAVKLTESLGQQVVVDNRPGAGGIIGTKIVVDATPDGHTLLAVSSSYAISPATYAKLPYDPRRDLAGITTTATAPYMIVVTNALPAKTLQDLIALAKAKPGQLNFSSAGMGSGTHFAAELFKATARIDTVHVPYKGVPEALADTIAGRVQYFMTPPSTLGTLVKEGKLRALAATGTQRHAQYPEVPTVTEAGLPGFLWQTWAALFAPRRTPQAIIDRLNREIVAALALPDVQQRYAALGVDAAPRTPAETDRFIHGELSRVAELARKVGIKPQ
jgi:tripartite-type tricarboxylate transporter receptor subunit TctC